MNLTYLMMESCDNGHPEKVIKELGITYLLATPNSCFDCWWFWCCENVPEKLPPFLKELSLDPNDAVGHGLSPDDVKKIKGCADV